jgi:hypothetical protein
MVQNPESGGLVSPKTATTPGQQRKHWVPKGGSSAYGSGGCQGQARPRSEASAKDNKAKPDAEKSPEEVAVEQVNTQGEKIDANVEVEMSSQQPLN